MAYGLVMARVGSQRGRLRRGGGQVTIIVAEGNQGGRREAPWCGRALVTAMFLVEKQRGPCYIVEKARIKDVA